MEEVSVRLRAGDFAGYVVELEHYAFLEVEVLLRGPEATIEE